VENVGSSGLLIDWGGVADSGGQDCPAHGWVACGLNSMEGTLAGVPSTLTCGPCDCGLGRPDEIDTDSLTSEVSSHCWSRALRCMLLAVVPMVKMAHCDQSVGSELGPLSGHLGEPFLVGHLPLPVGPIVG